jgi:DNA repair exonuclease SbcCD ATPase subunit
VSDKLEFDLVVGKNDLSKSLNQAKNDAQKLNDAITGISSPMDETRTSTKNLSDSMGDLFKSVTGVAGGMALFSIGQLILSTLSDTIHESIAAYAEQEDAVNKLNQSFVATGSYSEVAKNSVLDFSVELQKNSKFADEAIVAQVAFVKSLGATTETSKNLVLAAANMSATLGGSLDENVQKLGKTLSGVSGRLGAFVPELKSLTVEQLKAGEAADVINKKFGGASANDLKTYTGSIASAKNAFNDLEEEIGRILVKNSLTVSAIAIAKNSFEGLTKVIKHWGDMLVESGDDKKVNGVTKATNKFQDLKAKIDIVNTALASPMGSGFFQGVLKTSGELKIELENLTIARDKLLRQYPQAATPQTTPKEKIIDNRTPQEVENERVKQEEIKNIISQANQEKLNQQKAADLEVDKAFKEADANQITNLNERELAKINNETANNLAELERIREQELAKNALEESLALSKININEDKRLQEQEREKIHQTKKLADLKANQTAELKATQASQDGAKKIITKSNADNLKDQEAFFNVASSLSSAKNKEMQAIGKAAAITNIAIKTPDAIASSFAFGSRIGGPPLGFALGAIAAAAMAQQAATVAGIGFESGGVVGSGASIGADNRTANIRDGEMVLNASQQKNLLDMINNGGNNSPIVIQVDGREIARAVRNQVQGGFRLA